MKKRILIAVIIVLVLAYLGKRSEDDIKRDLIETEEKQTQVQQTDTPSGLRVPPAETEAAVPKREYPSYVIGTYIGDDGCAFTLRSNGEAEYFNYSKGLDTGCHWEYDGGIMTFSFSGYDYNVYAKIDAGTKGEILVYSDSDKWNNENYIKVSDKDQSVSAENYLYQLALRIPANYKPSFQADLNDTNSTVTEHGNLRFRVPKFFGDIDSDDTEKKQKVYYLDDSAHQKGFLSIKTLTLDADQTTFDTYKDKYMKQFLDDATSEYRYIYHQDIRCAGLPGYYAEAVGSMSDNIYSINISLIFDEKEHNLYYIFYAQYFGYSKAYFANSRNLVGSAEYVEKVPEKNGGVTPELKAFLDSYEAFIDEYVSFMKEYTKTDNAFAMLADYLSFMQKLADFSAKAEAYDESEMSDADLLYYLEVTTRISKKLLEAAL